jgi:hypothetical protein
MTEAELESLCDEIDLLSGKFPMVRYMENPTTTFHNHFHTPIDERFYYYVNLYNVCGARGHMHPTPHKNRHCKYQPGRGLNTLKYDNYTKWIQGEIIREVGLTFPDKWEKICYNKNHIRWEYSTDYMPYNVGYAIVNIESIPSLKIYLYNMKTFLATYEHHRELITEINSLRYMWMLKEEIILEWFPPEIIMKLILLLVD